MSSLAKLRLTLAVVAGTLRPRKKRIEASATGPHSRRWDEEERAETTRARQGTPSAARGLDMKVIGIVAVVFAASVAAELLLPPLVGTAVGLVLVTATLAYILRLRRGLLSRRSD